MYYKNELDLMSGIYRCHGDVKHLRFKVRLEVIKSSTIPLSNVEEQETGLDPQYNECEELEFCWNEKIFSPREFEFYRNDGNCHTSPEHEYHDRIEKLIANGTISPCNRLFTYTSRDSVPPNLHRNIFYKEEPVELSSEDDSFVSPNLPPSWLVSSRMQEAGVSLPVRNIVDYDPSDDLRRQNRALFARYEIMYIVADLSDRYRNSEGTTNLNNCNDYLLVTLKWNSGTSILIVMPDIVSSNTSGYKIDVDKSNDTRYVYRYWLLDVSQQMEEENKRTKENFAGELASHQSLCVPLDFDAPSNDARNYFLFGDIKKTVGFLCDNLFVQYFVQLPARWSTDSPELLFGSTQQCRNKNADYTALFSYLFEVEYSLSRPVADVHLNESESTGYSTPRMFFEICSLDDWKRFRVEGYAWLALPTIAGRFTCSLHAWRPASVTPRDQLTRYFLGSDCQLADPAFSGFPTYRNNLPSRYGLQTVSSGSIHLDLNVVQQAGSVALPPSKKSILFSDKLQTNTLMNSVNHILEAFRKARQRMLLAREPILLHADAAAE